MQHYNIIREAFGRMRSCDGENPGKVLIAPPRRLILEIDSIRRSWESEFVEFVDVAMWRRAEYRRKLPESTFE